MDVNNLKPETLNTAIRELRDDGISAETVKRLAVIFNECDNLAEFVHQITSQCIGNFTIGPAHPEYRAMFNVIGDYQTSTFVWGLLTGMKIARAQADYEILDRMLKLDED